MPKCARPIWRAGIDGQFRHDPASLPRPDARAVRRGRLDDRSGARQHLRPAWQILPYGALLAAGNRFFDWALFNGALLSLPGYGLAAAVLLLLAFAAYRVKPGRGAWWCNTPGSTSAPVPSPGASGSRVDGKLLRDRGRRCSDRSQSGFGGRHAPSGQAGQTGR
ncbi:MAG: DUF6867 family protein [Aliidongia sp.]